jgi:hypothetical protein
MILLYYYKYMKTLKTLIKSEALKSSAKILTQRRKCIEKYRNTLNKNKTKTTAKIREPTEPNEPYPQPRKRCPKGQYRNKEGNCVPNPYKSFKTLQRLAQEDEVKARLETEESPRKVYAEKYLTHRVHLLGNKWLFQVSFPNIEQFTNYTPLSKHTADCFIQTIFSLGMRCEKAVKEDIQKIRKKQCMSGVNPFEMMNYFEKIFGINRDHFKFATNVVSFKTPNEGVEKMTEFLHEKLENNYATILIVDLKYNNSSILGAHVMLAYKYNDIVYFFDPQRNRLERDPNTMSSENYIKKYHVFKTIGLKESVELKDSTCSIDFAGK